MTVDHPEKKTPKTAPKKQTGARSQAKPANRKPAEEITSKADLIRKVAGIIRAKGEKPRPTDIVRILEEEGVKVAVAQVSMTLKAAGYSPLRKRRKGKKSRGARVAKPSGGNSRSREISIDDLLAAKSVSGAFGGTDKAIAALQALKQFES
jgi:hypothetical protein